MECQLSLHLAASFLPHPSYSSVETAVFQESIKLPTNMQSRFLDQCMGSDDIACNCQQETISKIRHLRTASSMSPNGHEHCGTELIHLS